MSNGRTWRKSTYSGTTIDDNCVEVSLAHNALVRDSKNTTGPMLAFSTPAWRALVNWLV